MRDSASAETAASFKGRHNQRTAYEWNNVKFNRVEKWRNLKLRCLAMPANLLETGRRFTIIEDASAELELQEAAAKTTANSGVKLIELSVRNCKRMSKLLDLYLDVAKLDAGPDIPTAACRGGPRQR